MVKRRKVLFGIGAIAAGGAAATATGAFSAAQMNRDADINVVSDTNGLIALEPGDQDDVGSVVELTDNGELEIDFSGDDNAGVNVNSRYIVGSFHHGDIGSGPNQIDEAHVFDANNNQWGNGGTIHSSTMGAWGYAFSITNQDTESHDISISFEATQEEVEGYLGFHMETGWSSGETLEIQGTDTDGSVEFPDTPSGETIRVSFVVSTIDVEDYTEEDLSGTLTVNAN